MTPNERLERQLDDFDRGRREALTLLWRGAQTGGDALPEARGEVNAPRPHLLLIQCLRLFAVEVRLAGAEGGTGRRPASSISTFWTELEEFLEAGRLRWTEDAAPASRSGVFVPEFATRVDQFSRASRAWPITWASGFTRFRVAPLPDRDARRRRSNARATCSARVNAYLDAGRNSTSRGT